VWKAFFFCMFWKSSVTFLTSLPLHVKVEHFATWCYDLIWNEYLCIWFMLYGLLCSTFLMKFNSVSFASLLTGQ
jgi:hypothetical protein